MPVSINKQLVWFVDSFRSLSYYIVNTRITTTTTTTTAAAATIIITAKYNKTMSNANAKFNFLITNVI